jgi:hypothetical protein
VSHCIRNNFSQPWLLAQKQHNTHDLKLNYLPFQIHCPYFLQRARKSTQLDADSRCRWAALTKSTPIVLM